MNYLSVVYPLSHDLHENETRDEAECCETDYPAVKPTILFSALNLPRMDPERQLNRPYAGWVAEYRRAPSEGGTGAPLGDVTPETDATPALDGAAPDSRTVASRKREPCSLLAGAPPASRDGVTAFDET